MQVSIPRNHVVEVESTTNLLARGPAYIAWVRGSKSVGISGFAEAQRTDKSLGVRILWQDEECLK
jgi:hypothetical protein